jgi:ABC-type Fe3+/spermidine/putrescine transport system ATPase subunit
MLSVSDRMVWISDGRIERVAAREDVKIEKASLGTEDDE